MADKFVRGKTAEAREFTCGRCGNPKKSKTKVSWTDDKGVTKEICNGCYGELLSKK